MDDICHQSSDQVFGAFLRRRGVSATLHSVTIDPAAVAPGMRVSGASFAVLARATAHHDYEARTALHAIRILARLADARSIKLLDKLQRSKHPHIARAALAALAELRRVR